MRLLADLLLISHALVVAFVVLGQALVLVGGPLGWAFVRNRWFRYGHLVTIAVVVMQTWLGQYCFLTVWENHLRGQIGESGYGVSFVEYWLARLLYFEAPFIVFVLAYSAFFALVLFSLWRWPPRRPAPRPPG